MTDFGTMKTRVGNELKRAELTTEIRDAIISSLAFYKRQRFRWNTARATLTLQPNVEYYQLPTDFIEADTLVLRSSGDELDYLEERTHHWTDREKEWDGYRSRPDIFSIQTNELRMYPVPDRSYTALMSYVFEQSEISASASDSASNEWMTNGEELIRLHTKVDMLTNVIRGPESFQEAALLAGREHEVLKQLRKEYKRSQSSGRTTPWS